MVLEVDLDDFITQSKHDGMSCSHPLFNVDRADWRLAFSSDSIGSITFSVLMRGALLGRTRLKVTFEMLQESDFLLKLFWEFVKLVLSENVLFLA